jgi:malonate decarboxylase gamma subunit
MTPDFAPGIEPLFLTGAVTEKWDAEKPLARQLHAVLRRDADARNRRDEIGRLQAAQIRRVVTEAAAHV